MTHDEIRGAVRDRYSEVATRESAGCGCGTSCCDGSGGTEVTTTAALATGAAAATPSRSQQLGYSAEEVLFVPRGADMGLGCGNPQAIAALAPGEAVLDLGSGGGIDCFLAARQVGESGHVIGVDMTPAMVSKARSGADAGRFTNVEFRLGEIENLPVADATIDVIISNCVINLSPDKGRVFAEAYRVLRPGGRLAISDVVAFADLPEEVRADMALLTGCMAGASPVGEVERMLADTGFSAVRVTPKDESASFIREWAPGTNITDYVVSASIEAVKPD
jgi:arsenite methyltransferase